MALGEVKGGFAGEAGIGRRHALWLASLALTGCAATPVPRFDGPAEETVTVIGRGWHTELGLAVARLGPPLADLASQFPGAMTLAFGFGDRAFVLARHRNVGDALGALFPDPGLVLLTVLNTTPQVAFGTAHVVSLRVTRAGFDQIAGFIWNSLATKDGALPRPYGPGPYPGSLFFASAIPYDAFDTCNTWIAEALRAGGIPVQASGVLFASQIMREARRVEAAQSR